MSHVDRVQTPSTHLYHERRPNSPTAAATRCFTLGRRTRATKGARLATLVRERISSMQATTEGGGRVLHPKFRGYFFPGNWRLPNWVLSTCSSSSKSVLAALRVTGHRLSISHGPPDHRFISPSLPHSSVTPPAPISTRLARSTVEVSSTTAYGGNSCSRSAE